MQISETVMPLPPSRRRFIKSPLAVNASNTDLSWKNRAAAAIGCPHTAHRPAPLNSESGSLRCRVSASVAIPCGRQALNRTRLHGQHLQIDDVPAIVRSIQELTVLPASRPRSIQSTVSMVVQPLPVQVATATAVRCHRPHSLPSRDRS